MLLQATSFFTLPSRRREASYLFNEIRMPCKIINHNRLLISHQDTEASYHSCNINEIVDYGKKSVRKKKILYYVPTARDLVFYFSFVFRFSRLRISYLLVPGLHLFLTFLFVGFKQIMRD